ncbi:MAG: hypothetical protein H6R12_123 [Proteobacteria bacterium]|nr:hypothetical protein [Pseudomonadota bacterium]
MSASRTRGAWRRARAFAALITVPLLGAFAAAQCHAASFAPITGEIQSIRINDPNDHWSGGTMVVGGQNVTIPRNLLIDLPANRLTLQELFAQAPANCLSAGQTGLARADTCNASPVGAIANIHANRTGGGNIIAGDVFIQKGIEAVMGTITYIDYSDGYFRVNGNVGDAATGVMVRLNDPDGRHTVQQGLGCAAGNTVNCSPDPRFTLDGDNYTNVFSTGFPLCIPSTVARTVTTALPTTPSGITGVAAGTVAQSSATGSGDVLCPDTNRGTPGQPVQDSRRFAPIQVGDNINAEGNFEKVDGVQFLSAHTTMVSRALTTKSDLSQPDYLFLDEVEIDLAGFQNQRIRTLIIGFATLAPTDVNVWTIHYDPATNSPHEFPLASVVGCDIAAGPGTCGAQGLVGAGANIFKIRHDVDFLAGAKARLNPCAHLRADPFFAPLNICPNGGSAELNLTEMVGILTPIPHEIQARTGHALRAKAAGVVQTTLDVRGNQATNGQYLFPFGLGLGGIAAVEFVEINLDGIATPLFFSAMPWNLDRRLSPGGCIDTDGDGVPNCESTPQPLDPFPFEELDPRFQANLPTGSYSDPNYTSAPISDVRNRILSFVGAAPSRASNGFDAPAPGNFNGNASVLAWPPSNPGTQSILPTPNVELVCTATTTEPPPPPPPTTAPTTTNVDPVANPDVNIAGAVFVGNTVSVPVLLNDSDPNPGDVLTITGVSNVVGGTATFTASAVQFTATVAGPGGFTYTISDGNGGTATGTATLDVLPPEQLTVLATQFRTVRQEWRVNGTDTTEGATITVRLGGPAGPVVGTSTVLAGAWAVRVAGSGIVPVAGDTITVQSSGGATVTGVPVVVRR